MVPLTVVTSATIAAAIESAGADECPVIEIAPGSHVLEEPLLLSKPCTLVTSECACEENERNPVVLLARDCSVVVVTSGGPCCLRQLCLRQESSWPLRQQCPPCLLVEGSASLKVDACILERDQTGGLGFTASDDDSYAAPPCVLASGRTEIVMTDCSVTTADGCFGAGVIVLDHALASVTRCTISGHSGPSVAVSSSQKTLLSSNTITRGQSNAVVVSGSSTVCLVDNIISLHELAAVFLKDSSSAVMERNIIRDNMMSGLCLTALSSGKLSENVFSKNDRHGVRQQDACVVQSRGDTYVENGGYGVSTEGLKCNLDVSTATFTSNRKGAVSCTGDTCVIKLNDITGSKDVRSVGVFVRGGRSCNVTENQFSNNKGTAVKVETGVGECTIDMNSIKDGSTGIFVGCGSQCVVTGNTISHCTDNGMDLLGPCGADISTGPTVSHNRCSDCGGYGIAVFSGSPLIKENILKENRRGGVCVEGADASPRICDGQIRGSAGPGVYVSKGANVSLSNNEISGNVCGINFIDTARGCADTNSILNNQEGVRLTNCADPGPSLSCNKIFDNDGVGVYVSNAAGQFLDNVIKRNHTGLTCSSSAAVFENNVICGSRDDGIMMMGTGDGTKLSKHQTCRFENIDVYDSGGHGMSICGKAAGVFRQCRFHSNGGCGVTVQGPDVSASMIDCDAFDNISGTQLQVNSTHDVLLQDCIIIQECRFFNTASSDSLKGSRSVGVLISRGAKPTLKSNDIYASHVGISIASGGDPLIEENKIHNCVIGLRVEAGGLAMVKANDVFENELIGIELCENACPHQIFMNRVHSNQNVGVIVGCQCSLSENLVFENGGAGVLIKASAAGAVVEGNELFSALTEALLLDETVGVCIRDNVFHKNIGSATGLRVSRGRDNIVDHNEFHHNECAMSVSTAASLTTSRNVFESNGIGVRCPGRDISLSITENTFVANTNAGVAVDDVGLDPNEQHTSGTGVAIADNSFVVPPMASGIDVHCGLGSKLLASNNTFTSDSTSLTGVGMNVTESDPEVRGCSFQTLATGIFTQHACPLIAGNDFKATSSVGIHVSDGQGHIEKNDFHCSDTGVMISGKSSDPAIVSNTFRGGFQGVCCRQASGGRVNANVFDRTECGISMLSSSNPVISSNHFQHCGSAAIRCEGCQGVLEDNEISDGHAEGIFIINANPYVTGNRLTGNDVGISVVQCGSAVIEDNHIFGSLNSGVVVSDGGSAKLSKNHIQEWLAPCIKVSSHATCVLEENEICSGAPTTLPTTPPSPVKDAWAPRNTSLFPGDSSPPTSPGHLQAVRMIRIKVSFKSRVRVVSIGLPAPVATLRQHLASALHAEEDTLCLTWTSPQGDSTHMRDENDLRSFLRAGEPLCLSVSELTSPTSKMSPQHRLRRADHSRVALVEIYGPVDCELLHNKLHHSDVGVLVADGVSTQQRIRMRFNDISECATSGVLVTGASEPLIQKNTFRHCAVGVTVEDGGGAVLLENIISHSSTSALVPANAVGRTVGLADNRFTNNSGGGQ